MEAGAFPLRSSLHRSNGSVLLAIACRGWLFSSQENGARFTDRALFYAASLSVQLLLEAAPGWFVEHSAGSACYSFSRSEGNGGEGCGFYRLNRLRLGVAHCRSGCKYPLASKATLNRNDS